MNRFMERALLLAMENVRAGGEPFGAVLVKDGQIVAEGVNESHKRYDVSAHAELIAIQKAQEKAKTHRLTGYTMYASGEPCPMCLAAMYFAGITDVYFCQSVREAAAVGLDVSSKIYADLKKPNEARLIVKKQIPLEKNQENPMKEWSKNG